MRRLLRLAIVPLIALCLSIVPIRSVVACSCAMPPSPAEIIATSEVAFIGSVTGVAEARGNDFGQMFAYAFEVERANRDVAAVIQVHAIGGDGGASCGMDFGVGQRWFISAYSGPQGLETGLCSGNVLLDPANAEAGAEFASLLDVTPVPTEEAEAGLDIPAGVVAIGAAVALLLVGSLLAFRRGAST